MDLSQKTEFASNFFIFWKFRFSLGASNKEIIPCTNDLNAHIRTLCKCFFPVSILKQIFYSKIIRHNIIAETLLGDKLIELTDR